VRQSVPVEDTDGEFLRIAVQAVTTGGSVSDRQVLRLRRPAARSHRGGLRVLAIGVDAYEHPPPLAFAHAAAPHLAEAFKARGGEGLVYPRADVRSLTNREATLERLRRALDDFTTSVEPGQTLVLALSGHGIRVGPPPEDLAGMSLAAMMSRPRPE